MQTRSDSIKDARQPNVVRFARDEVAGSLAGSANAESEFRSRGWSLGLSMARPHLPGDCAVSAGADLVVIRPVSSIERARAFWNDPQLRCIASMLSEAHGLVIGATVPASVRRRLTDIADQLDELLHGAPHLVARTRVGGRRSVEE